MGLFGKKKAAAGGKASGLAGTSFDALEADVVALTADARSHIDRLAAAAVPASDEDLLELSRRFNAVLRELEEDGNRSAGWFALFNDVDYDGSGNISYTELVVIVRENLKLSEAELPEGELLGLWRRLDADGSGRITVDEFSRFMRLDEESAGPGVGEAAAARRAALAAQKAELAAAKREEDALRRGEAIRRELAGVPSASKEEVLGLSVRFNAVLREQQPDPSKRSWFKLFSSVDFDGSGHISYAELVVVVRESLLLSEAKLPELSLKQLWLALDVDASGQITADEFGAFMRLDEESNAPGVAEAAAARRAALTQKRGGAAAAKKEEDAMRKGAHIRRELAALGLPKASADEVEALSRRFNQRMCELQPDPSKRSWFALFNNVDTDGSGNISFGELLAVVRESLRISEVRLPERSLKQLWLALDVDASGQITADEFGAFMNLTMVPKVLSGAARREKLAAQKRAEGDKVRAVESALRHRALAEEMAGVPPASAEQVAQMSVRFNEQLAKLCADPTSSLGGKAHLSWFKLFRALDDDNTGQISFDELQNMVRGTMRLGVAEVSEEELKLLWLALDADGSGLISVGEFAKFMRGGEAKPWRREKSAAAEGEAAAGARRQDSLPTLGSSASQVVFTTAAEAEAYMTALRAQREAYLAEYELQWEDEMRQEVALKSAATRRAADEYEDRLRYANAREYGRLVARIELRERRLTKGTGVIKGLSGETQRLLHRRIQQAAGIDIREDVATPGKPTLYTRKYRPQQGLSASQSLGDLVSLPEWRLKAIEANRAAAEKVRAEAGALRHRSIREEMAGAPAASAAEVVQMSRRFNGQLTILCQDPTSAFFVGGGKRAKGSSKTWIKMFRKLDEDNTGLISYDELSRMVRGTMRLAPAALPEASLKALWLHLDADDSGLISVGEFGKFMRKGAPEPPPRVLSPNLPVRTRRLPAAAASPSATGASAAAGTGTGSATTAVACSPPTSATAAAAEPHAATATRGVAEAGAPAEPPADSPSSSPGGRRQRVKTPDAGAERMRKASSLPRLPPRHLVLQPRPGTGDHGIAWGAGAGKNGALLRSGAHHRAQEVGAEAPYRRPGFRL